MQKQGRENTAFHVFHESNWLVEKPECGPELL